jgi:hypothetical protein
MNTTTKHTSGPWTLETVPTQIEEIGREMANIGLPLVTITTEDRLRGAIVESLSLLECGHQTAAYQVLTDALKIGGVK